MNLLKQFLRVLISASIGIQLVNYLELNSILTVIFFFGIYIVVSILLEAIWILFSKNKLQNSGTKSKKTDN